MCKADPNAMTVPPKGETVVHPAGRNWVMDDPTFDYVGPTEAAYDRLSALPRASTTDKVGLVLGTLWNRACGRSRWLSCAILIAALVFVGISVAMEQLSHLIP